MKKTKITVSTTEKSMTLTLLPFNDSYESEASTLSGLKEQKSKTGKSSKSSSNAKLKNVLSGADQKYLEKIVNGFDSLYEQYTFEKLKQHILSLKNPE